MQIQRVKMNDRDEFEWRLRITGAEYASARFDRFDRLLLDDCKDGSVADVLLALELIARRIEQRHPRPAPEVVSA